MSNVLAIGLPGGPGEWILIAGIALLLFGKRLPEVGRSLGKGIVEFKKGLKGIEEDIDTETSKSRPQIAQQAQFDPYTGKPVKPENVSNPPAGSV